MAPAAVDDGTVLCRLEDIPDGEARSFRVEDGGEPVEVFVLRRGTNLVAYVNSCPHIGTPLDMIPDRLLNRDRSRFLCATHGAEFRFDDGHCVKGPCRGASLTAIPVRLADGRVVADMHGRAR